MSVKLTQVVAPDGSPVAAPCAIEGCQYANNAEHARLWRRHVQMLRRKHPPHVVQELIDAVKSFDAARDEASK